MTRCLTTPRMETPCVAGDVRGGDGVAATQAMARWAAGGRADRGEVGRLSGPIGLDLGARTAMETALSILGEIVAVSHDRDGGRLRGADGPIREARA